MSKYEQVYFSVDEDNKIVMIFYAEVSKDIAGFVDDAEMLEFENIMDGTKEYKYYIPMFLKFDAEGCKDVISALQSTLIKHNEIKDEKIKKLFGMI